LRSTNCYNKKKEYIYFQYEEEKGEREIEEKERKDINVLGVMS
jgi:hypothetical protein